MEVKGNAFGDALYVTLYSKNMGGNVSFMIYDLDYSDKTNLTTIASQSLPKGTYYILVEKENQKVSGNYAIKVSKR